MHDVHFLLQCKLRILNCCDSMMSYLHTQIERKKENNYFLVKMSIIFQYNFSYSHMLVNIERERERERERVPEEVSSSKLRTKIQMVIPNVITTHKVQYTFNPTIFTLMLLHLYSSSSTYIRRLGIGEFRQCKSYM